jgi:serine/threonine-protein kinase
MAAVQPENKIGIGSLLLGKYKVTRELGRGGMAAVYEAENVSIGKKIAVKVLASELANSSIVIERFFREARAAASVKSPYIVEVYDSGRLEDGRPFIAMELLEGESLYDRMARVRLFDTTTTVRIIGQVAKGLVKAHVAGIVHRDLKPENIHICTGEDGDEIAKILDFGLAKFYAPVNPDEKSARLTREGAVFGTPAYMSPEQVKGHGTVDHRADLWALGCMTYECLTGRPVWNTDQGVAMTFASIAAAQLPTPSRVRPDLPVAFDAWFRKALERDPNKRFQGAKELAEELARALGAPPISLVNFGSPSLLELEAMSSGNEPLRQERAPLSSRPRRAGDAPAASRPGVGSAMVPAAAPASAAAPSSTSKARGADTLSAADGSPLSATDPPPTAAPEAPAAAPFRFAGGWRWAGAALLVVVAVPVAWLVYAKLIQPRSAKAHATDAALAASSVASASDSSSASPAADPQPQPPRWMTILEDGQQALASGDLDSAQRKFRDATDAGAGAIGKSFLDQLKLAMSTPGPCKLAALSHPRMGYGGGLGRPAVAATSKGAVVAWTDDHEQAGHDHVYSVFVDSVGRPTSRVRDLTPEADYAMRPELTSFGDRVALLFWDKSGRDPGVRVRWLTEEGQIGGMISVVASGKKGLFWPAMSRASDGSFWVAWQQSPDKDGDDVYLRHLDPDLKPAGSEVRATDYQGEKGKVPRVTSSSIALSGTNLFVAFALDREKLHLVERMRVGLSAPELVAGLQGTAKGSRELGEVATVNDEKIGGEYPSLACAKDACFLVWHETDKTAAAAAFDPNKGTLLWRKRFAAHGGHPAVAESEGGQAAVAFYEGGKVRVAPISRDGLGAATTFAKVAGDAPRPWIAPGRARGEWLISWLDVEAGHSEAFLARLQCRD